MTDYDRAAAAFDTPGPVPEWASEPHSVMSYRYVDENEDLLYTVHRGADKSFRQQAADGIWKMTGVRLVLFGLPDVLKAAADGKTIHVNEGEKDVCALTFSGHVATTAPGGAKAKWRPEYTESLKGAKEVVIWQDKDKPGREHTAEVAESLKTAGIPYRIVEARAGKDAWDHLTAGWTVEDAVPVTEGPTPLERMRSKLIDREGLRKIKPKPYLIKGWVDRNSPTRINGDPGSGKSLISLDMAACIGLGIPWCGCPTRKGKVIYVIAEGVEGFTKRADAWEMHHKREIENVLFYPEPIQILGRTNGVLTESEEWAVFRELCREEEPDLVILDTQRRVTGAAAENDNTDLQTAVNCLDDMRRETGATWMLVHHTPKNGTGGSGAGAVRASLDTELETSKKDKGLSARFLLENTKEKDHEDGTKLTFELKQYVTHEGDPNRFADDERQTSVVLVPAVAEAPPDDLLPGFDDGPASHQKLAGIIRAVWKNGVVIKSEVKSVATVAKAPAKAPMSQSTFYVAWDELIASGLVTPCVNGKGVESRTHFDVRTSGEQQ